MYYKTVLLEGGPWHGQSREVTECTTGFRQAEFPPEAATLCHEPVTPTYCTYKVWQYIGTGRLTRGGAEIFSCE